MKKELINELKISLPSQSVNESAARAIVSAFITQLNPTVEELSDVRCAVSEAVTNSIVHGYRNRVGIISIDVKLFSDRSAKIDIRDRGCGISDVEEAMQPLFTTDPGGERSGMGFTVMENFTDSISVRSTTGKGTKVSMTKKMSPLPIHKR